jgi:glycosyltransferase involved in cell wall biosynthesis
MAENELHILISSLRHYPDRPSGAERLAYDEARYLAAAGHRVTMLAATDDDAPPVQRDGQISLLRYRPRSFHAADPRRAWAHQTAAKEILRKHIDARVDIVHGHAPLTYLAARDLIGNHAQTVFTVHSPITMEMEIAWPRRTFGDKLRRGFGLPLLNRMERACLERSAAVTADSEFTRQQLIRIHGEKAAGSVQVIPGWVDLDRFQIIDDRSSAKASLGWPLDVPLFFTLRRLVPRMGLDRLIRAIAIVRDRRQSMHLVIGGDGPLCDELRQLSASLGLDEWIRFAGRVPDAELPKMYGACDAFVLPTAALECFGLISIEALACGRPVLATPVAAIPELLSNFDSRWLARSADEHAIADLISAFLSHELPAHSPAELRQRAQELYSQEKRLRQLSDLVLGLR